MTARTVQPAGDQGASRPAPVGPRQVWTWSRVDGEIRRHRVRPIIHKVYWMGERMVEDIPLWLEDLPDGWARWPDDYLHDSPEAARQAARDHYLKVVQHAQGVLARLATPPPIAEEGR
jgi:hypothetical protein